MKGNVGSDVSVWVAGVFVHLLNRLLHCLQVACISSLGSESSGGHLKGLPDFAQIVVRSRADGEKSLELGTQRACVRHRDKSPAPGPNLDQPPFGEQLDRFAYGTTAHLHPLRQFAFWGKPITGFQVSLGNEILDVRGYVLVQSRSGYLLV